MPMKALPGTRNKQKEKVSGNTRPESRPWILENEAKYDRMKVC